LAVRKRLPSSWTVVIAAVACLVMVLFMALNQAWGQLARFQAKATALQASTVALTDEIGRLRREVEAIRTDPRRVEEHARRHFLYAKPGETLTVIHRESSPP
jgi:cell division protein FtsB